MFAQEIVNLGPLAQSVEQRTFNPWVVGSIPTGPTSKGPSQMAPRFELFACEYLIKVDGRLNSSLEEYKLH